MTNAGDKRVGRAAPRAVLGGVAGHQVEADTPVVEEYAGGAGHEIGEPKPLAFELMSDTPMPSPSTAHR